MASICDVNNVASSITLTPYMVDLQDPDECLELCDGEAEKLSQPGCCYMSLDNGVEPLTCEFSSYAASVGGSVAASSSGTGASRGLPSSLSTYPRHPTKITSLCGRQSNVGSVLAGSASADGSRLKDGSLKSSNQTDHTGDGSCLGNQALNSVSVPADQVCIDFRELVKLEFCAAVNEYMSDVHADSMVGSGVATQVAQGNGVKAVDFRDVDCNMDVTLTNVEYLNDVVKNRLQISRSRRQLVVDSGLGPGSGPGNGFFHDLGVGEITDAGSEFPADPAEPQEQVRLLHDVVAASGRKESSGEADAGSYKGLAYEMMGESQGLTESRESGRVAAESLLDPILDWLTYLVAEEDPMSRARTTQAAEIMPEDDMILRRNLVGHQRADFDDRQRSNSRRVQRRADSAVSHSHGSQAPLDHSSDSHHGLGTSTSIPLVLRNLQLQGGATAASGLIERPILVDFAISNVFASASPTTPLGVSLMQVLNADLSTISALFSTKLQAAINTSISSNLLVDASNTEIYGFNGIIPAVDQVSGSLLITLMTTTSTTTAAPVLTPTGPMAPASAIPTASVTTPSPPAPEEEAMKENTEEDSPHMTEEEREQMQQAALLGSAVAVVGAVGLIYLGFAFEEMLQMCLDKISDAATKMLAKYKKDKEKKEEEKKAKEAKDEEERQVIEDGATKQSTCNWTAVGYVLAILLFGCILYYLLQDPTYVKMFKEGVATAVISTMIIMLLFWILAFVANCLFNYVMGKSFKKLIEKAKKFKERHPFVFPVILLAIIAGILAYFLTQGGDDVFGPAMVMSIMVTVGMILLGVAIFSVKAFLSVS